MSGVVAILVLDVSIRTAAASPASGAHPDAANPVGKFVIDSPPVPGPDADEDTKSSRKAEGVDYRMLWVIRLDGTETKEYSFTYRGERTLARLSEYAGGDDRVPGFLENLLPHRDSLDRRVSREKEAEGVFTWTYTRGPDAGSPRPKSDLLLWLPVYEDPVALPWEAVDGSALEYRLRDFEVTNRLIVHMPWNLAGRLSTMRKTYDAGPISARLSAVPTDGDGNGLVGYELKAVLRSDDGRLDQEELERFRSEVTRWVFARLNGVILPGEDTGSVPNSRKSFYFLRTRTQLSYGSVLRDGRSFGGWGGGVGLRLENPLGRRWTWNPVSIDLEYHTGHEPRAGTEGPGFSVTHLDFGLTTELSFRLPYGYPSDEPVSTFSFLELTGAAGGRYAYFKFTGDAESERAWTPAVSVGLRWGNVLPFTGAFFGKPLTTALTFRYHHYTRESPANGFFTIGLEAF